MPKFNKAREAQFTAEQVRRRVRYIAKTGEFFYLIFYGMPVDGTKRADHQGQSGYRYIKFDGIGFPAHRVAWLIQTGEWPEGEVDHQDQVKNNNKWANLRLAKRGQNQSNSKLYKNNRIGLRGVSTIPTRPGLYRARIRKDGREYSLGVWPTPEAAYAAYTEAAKELHGEFRSSA